MPACLALVLLAVLWIPTSAHADAPSALLVRDARVFDGVDETLRRRDVLVVGDTIEAVGKGLEAPPGATVVEAEGRIVTPGLIDLGHDRSTRAPGAASRRKALRPASALRAAGGFMFPIPR